MSSSIKTIFGNQRLVLLLRLILGGIFITASLSKVSNIPEFTQAVASYNVLPHILAQLYGYLVPWTEFVIGCLLILGLFSRVAAAVSILLTSSFVVANIYGLINGMADTCGCFGQSMPMGHSQSLIVDALMLLMAVPLVLKKSTLASVGAYLSQSNNGSLRSMQTGHFVGGKLTVIMTALLLLTSFAPQITQAVTPADEPVADSETLVSTKIDNSLQSGKPSFLFFYADWCGYCQEQKPIIEELQVEYDEDVEFLWMNEKDHQAELQEFDVAGFPAMLLITAREGDDYVQAKFGGYTEKQVLVEELNLALGKTSTNSGCNIQTGNVSSQGGCVTTDCGNTETASAATTELSLNRTFDAVLNGGKPVFLFFYADWCGYCQKQKPIIEELQAQYGADVEFLLLNEKDHRAELQEFGVTGFPTMFLITEKVDDEYRYTRFGGYKDEVTLTATLSAAIGGAQGEDTGTLRSLSLEPGTSTNQVTAAAAGGSTCASQWTIDACRAGCDLAFTACDIGCGGCRVGCDAAFWTCDLGCDACDFGCGVAFDACDTGCTMCGGAEALCKDGCNAAEGACSGVCGAAEDACKLGCSAAEGACGLLCDVADGACYVSCGAKYAACVAKIAFQCWPWDTGCYNSHYATCENNLNSCTNGCNANCDFCVMNCEEACTLDCDGCKLSCESACEFDCDVCQSTCNNARTDCEAGCDVCQTTCNNERANCETTCDNCQTTCDSERASCKAACDAFNPCQGVGELCQPIPGLPGECADGLTCFPTFGLDVFNNQTFTCFPSETDEMISDELCLSFYSKVLHQSAISDDTVVTYSATIGAAAAGATSSEIGVVYSPDGQYGCFMTQCTGVETDLSISSAACNGIYTSLDVLPGQSIVTVEEVSLGVFVSTLQVWSVQDVFTGMENCLGLESVSPEDIILPVDAGLYSCSTIVDIVGQMDESGNFMATSLELENVAPVVNAGPDATIGEGDTFVSSGFFIDPYSETWTATVDYGDGLGAEPLSLNVDKSFELNHTYTTSGIYTVTVTVTDDDSASGSDTAEVTVLGDNLPPVVDTGPDASIDEGDPFTGSGSFTDPDSETWTATVDYGDGSGAETLSLNVDKTFDLEHIYAFCGTYTVTVTVTDDDGNIGADTLDVSSVDNIPPVINLLGENPQTIECGDDYTEPGATSLDTCCGELTTSIIIDASAVDTSVVDTYTVTYDVTDCSGNPAVQVTRTVEVVDNTAPVITLLGDDPQTIECGDDYTELGATALDTCCGELTADIVIDASAVDTSVVDAYTVTYDVTDCSGNPAVQVTRTVNVVDTIPPVITLLGENPQTIECGDAYIELGATALDTCCGDLTTDIVIDASAVNTSAVGTYTVTYDVIDCSGNAAVRVTRTVNVVDTIPPVITLLGENPQTIECGDAYTELGATALDTCCGDLTTSIVIDASNVDTSGVDTYTVTYDVTDCSGNVAVRVTRTVNVVDTAPPVISISVSPDVLWPPNHQMVQITVAVTVSDNVDPNPTVLLISVESSEPDDAKGNGDGKTTNDIQGAEIGTDDYEFWLRAERAGGGSGRIYTITYTVTDASGNSASASAVVIVPHNK